MLSLNIKCFLTDHNIIQHVLVHLVLYKKQQQITTLHPYHHKLPARVQIFWNKTYFFAKHDLINVAKMYCFYNAVIFSFVYCEHFFI